MSPSVRRDGPSWLAAETITVLTGTIVRVRNGESSRSMAATRASSAAVWRSSSLGGLPSESNGPHRTRILEPASAIGGSPLPGASPASQEAALARSAGLRYSTTWSGQPLYVAWIRVTTAGRFGADVGRVRLELQALATEATEDGLGRCRVAEVGIRRGGRRRDGRGRGRDRGRAACGGEHGARDERGHKPGREEVWFGA